MNRVCVSENRYGGAPYIEHTDILVHEVIACLTVAAGKAGHDVDIWYDDIDPEFLKELFAQFHRLCHESLVNLLDYYRQHEAKLNYRVRKRIEKMRFEEEALHEHELMEAAERAELHVVSSS